VSALSFEGSFLGDASRIPDNARLECGVCWHVYDPATGDDVWQIAAGTPFAALPTHWRCPVCDARRDQFILLEGRSELDARVDALLDVYERAEANMRELPIYNPALSVESVGFCATTNGLAGIVITPWFMNLVTIPSTPVRTGVDAKATLAFPSGEYVFDATDPEGFGPLLTCSLFSPMADFATQEAARDTARAAMSELFTAPASPPPTVTSRRALFTGVR
jgi:[NiFe] hydrogenase assembly HybE family chaperone